MNCEPDIFPRNSSQKPSGPSRRHSGFSLIEVMIALGILFIALFTILGLVSQLLRNARAFQNKKAVDATMVQAYDLSTTNRVTEGEKRGEFSDLADFGDQYRDYEFVVNTTFFASNGLWQVDYAVINRRNGSVESSISTFRFDPNTQQAGSGMGMPR